MGFGNWLNLFGRRYKLDAGPFLSTITIRIGFTWTPIRCYGCIIKYSCNIFEEDIVRCSINHGKIMAIGFVVLLHGLEHD